MYENIRKPGWLRPIPGMLIRSLPAVYYYARFSKNDSSGFHRRYYEMHVHYLIDALNTLGQTLKTNEFADVGGELQKLPGTMPAERLAVTETTVRRLAGVCSKLNKALQDRRSEWVPLLKDLYLNTVDPLQLTVVDYRNTPARVKKLHQLLTGSCYYHTHCIPCISVKYQNEILNAACIVLTDIQPAGLNRDYQHIEAYHRPALVIIPKEDRHTTEQPAIRRASRLTRLGIDILFYYLTPIRLYTTIEKTVMRYYAGAAA